MPVSVPDGPGFGLAPGESVLYNASMTLVPIVVVVGAIVVIALVIAWMVRDRPGPRYKRRTVAM